LELLKPGYDGSGYCTDPQVTNATQVGDATHGNGKDGKYVKGNHHVFCKDNFHVEQEFKCGTDGKFSPNEINCLGNG
jgi:hypothetical protein